MSGVVLDVGFDVGRHADSTAPPSGVESQRTTTKFSLLPTCFGVHV